VPRALGSLPVLGGLPVRPARAAGRTTPTDTPVPRQAVRPVGYGAMGTPTVVALVLAGLAAIATAVP